MGSSQEIVSRPVRGNRSVGDLSHDELSYSGLHSPDDPSVPDSEDRTFPTAGKSKLDRIDRYRIERVLDTGSFSTVYLCTDDEFNRLVAVKVIDPRKLPPGDDAWRAEARTLGRLDHPSIVPVFDAGVTAQWQPFVVSKFMAGGSLKQVIAAKSAKVEWSVAVVADIAEALEHAHARHLVHRDIKPGNILLDDRGKAYLADFGIALREDNFGRGAEFVGTVPYMSPEQARGEGHRVDGRSDLFGLGTVFFELLFGERLFVADTRQQVLDAICSFDPDDLHVPPHLVPEEVLRVLRRMMAPRLLDRYQDGRSVADDLRSWLRTAPVSAAERVPIPVRRQSENLSPRGLCAFGERDAQAFLDLVPGPHGADGVPKVVRFWIDRLDVDPLEMRSAPPPVGFMYGPSGCGKSSLVAAGILPRLSPLVRRIIVDCGVSDPAASLLRTLDPPPIDDATERSTTTDLPSSIASIRRHGGKKTLIVLDQFEQWLARWDGSANDPLVRGLRQCDGRTVQVLILVRDDFWSSTQRFLRELDTNLAEGANATCIEGFSVNHARKVLLRLGRATHAVPETTSDSQSESTTSAANGEVAKFVNSVIAELNVGKGIVAARIALLLEAVGDLPWTKSTLEKIGGVSGAASHLLESTFGLAAPPSQRRHRNAAIRLLESLVPADSTIDLKGAARTDDDLREACGYEDRPDDFRDLMNLLENRLKFVTAGDGTSDSSETTSTIHRQLTHDYLVNPLRSWIAADRDVGWRARLERRIDLLGRAFAVVPETRNLPAWYEWPALLVIYTGSKHTFKRADRSKMLARANRYYGTTFLLLAIAASLAAAYGTGFYRRTQGRQIAREVLATETALLQPVLAEFQTLESHAAPILHAALQSNSIDGRPFDAKAATRARVALLSKDRNQLQPVLSAAIASDAEELAALLPLLDPVARECAAELWPIATSAGESSRRRLHAAAALAHFDNGNDRWRTMAADIAVLLSQIDLSRSRSYFDLLLPVQQKLREPLITIFHRRSMEEAGAVAAAALGVFHRDDLRPLVDLALDASDRQLKLLKDVLAEQPDRVIPMLQAKLDNNRPPVESSAGQQSTRYRIQAKATVLLASLGYAKKLDAALADAGDPTVRSHLVRLHAAIGLGFEPLLRDACQSGRPAAVRFGRLLCLGHYIELGLTDAHVDELTVRMTDLYRNDPDSGIHSVAGGLLEKVHGQKATDVLDREFLDHFLKNGRRPGFDWYVSPNLHTMAIVRIPGKRKSFAVATRETTVRQFLNFKKDHRYDRALSPTPMHPVNTATLDHAYAYVCWLTNLKGDAARNPAVASIAKMEPQPWGIRPPDQTGWSGFRLPSMEEWIVACNAGAKTMWSFGNDPECGTHFVKHDANRGNSLLQAGEMPPNSLGLFETNGNVAEYTALHRSKLPKHNFHLGSQLMGGHVYSKLAGTKTIPGIFLHMPDSNEQDIRLKGFRIAQSLDDE